MDNSVLVTITPTGRATHRVADVEINNGVDVLTMCGKIMPATILIDVPPGAVTCQMCNSNNRRMGKGQGLRS